MMEKAGGVSAEDDVNTWFLPPYLLCDPHHVIGLLMPMEWDGRHLGLLPLQVVQGREHSPFNPFQPKVEDISLIPFPGSQIGQGPSSHGEEVGRHIFAIGFVIAGELGHVDEE